MIRLSRWLIRLAGLLNAAAIQVSHLARHVLERARPSGALALAFVLLLGSCSTLPPGLIRTQAQVEQALSDLADIEDVDLVQALALTPPNDIESSTCWSGLRPITAELKAAKSSGQPLLPQAKGFFSAFQIVRNGVRSVLGLGQTQGSDGKPSIFARINVACGPLVASADVDAMKLTVKIAGDVSAASTGIGALPVAMKALSAIKVLLPVPVPF